MSMESWHCLFLLARHEIQRIGGVSDGQLSCFDDVMIKRGLPSTTPLNNTITEKKHRNNRRLMTTA